MGGEREKVLNANVMRTSVGAISIGTKNPIRVHENKGEVHFHDDKAGLKVAVKTDMFFKRWTEFRQRMMDDNSKVTFYDESRQTVAIISSNIGTSRGSVKVDAHVRIEKVEISPAMGSLLDFGAGK